MTEIDAHIVATEDATADMPRLQSAKTPNEIYAAIFNRFLFRVHGMNCGAALETAREAYQKPEEQPSEHLSLALVHRVIAIMDASNAHLPPEDVHALLLWISGSSDVPGYFNHAIQHIDDRASQIALQQIGSYAANTHSRLDQKDKKMFHEMVRILPSHARSAISGLIMEARWCAADGDGEGSRLKTIAARELATLLLKNKMRAEKALFFHDHLP